MDNVNYEVRRRSDNDSPLRQLRRTSCLTISTGRRDALRELVVGDWQPWEHTFRMREQVHEIAKAVSGNFRAFLRAQIRPETRGAPARPERKPATDVARCR
jgi:hypothetical protein